MCIDKEFIIPKSYWHGLDFLMVDLTQWFSEKPKLCVTDDVLEKIKRNCYGWIASLAETSVIHNISKSHCFCIEIFRQPAN